MVDRATVYLKLAAPLPIFRKITSQDNRKPLPGMDRQQAAKHFRNEHETLFLPSFCDIRLVFAVVVIAELLAFVLVLASSDADPWSQLGLVSLFVQWIALASAAVLCVARPMLSRISNLAAGLTAYLLLLLTTAMISELAWWLGDLGRTSGDAQNHAGFLFRNLGISAILSALVLRYLFVQHQWRQQINAEAQARVQALQARIRPHFLFNSMNSIAALTRTDARRAEQAVQDLSDLFRVTLREASALVTLEEELEVARRYLRMESLRLGARLQVEWDVDRLPRKRLLPSLILQPLLENAVYHGVEPLPEGGRISIEGQAEGRRITIIIRNPRAQVGADAHREGNRIALENIRLRLQLAFGPQAGVALRESGDEFETTLYFPREKLQ